YIKGIEIKAAAFVEVERAGLILVELGRELARCGEAGRQQGQEIDQTDLLHAANLKQHSAHTIAKQDYLRDQLARQRLQARADGGEDLLGQHQGAAGAARGRRA